MAEERRRILQKSGYATIKNMNNKEYISELSHRHGFSQEDTQRMTRCIVELMSRQFEKGSGVRVDGFGLFETRQRMERIIVNPSTGLRMLVPPKLVVCLRLTPSTNVSRTKDSGLVPLSSFAPVLTERFGISDDDAHLFVDDMFALLKSELLSSDKPVKIKGLGSFKGKTLHSDDEEVNATLTRVSFTPETGLRDRVNRPFLHFESVVLNDGVDFSEMDNDPKTDATADSETDTSEVSVTDLPSGNAADSLCDNETEINATRNDGNTPENSAAEDDTPDNGNAADEDVTCGKATMCEDKEEEPHAEASHDEEDDLFDDAKDSVLENKGEESPRDNIITHSSNDIVCPARNSDDEEEGRDDEFFEEDDRPKGESEEAQKEHDDYFDVEDNATNGNERILEKPDEHLNEGHNGPREDDEPIEEDIEPANEHDTPSKTERLSLENGNVKSMPIAEKPDEHRPPKLLCYVGIASLIVLACLSAAFLCLYIDRGRADTHPARTELTGGNSTTPREAHAKAPRQQTVAADTAARDTVAVHPARGEQMADPASQGSDNAAMTPRHDAGVPTATDRSPSADVTVVAQPARHAKEPASADYNYDARVRTGAYIIVGTEKEVKVRKGQTLASISKAHLGEGMVCYLEVYNNCREVKPGDTVKIPKLKIKPRRRQ